MNVIPITPAKTPDKTPTNALPNTCSSSELLALQVLDDSMAPEFNPGHIVVIDGSAKLVPGAYVLIRRVSEISSEQTINVSTGWIIRRWNPVNALQVVLETLNSNWADERANACDVEVQGVVVQRAGRRRAERRHYR